MTRNGPASAVFEAVNVRDVRMVERGQHLRFAAEARQPFGSAATAGSSTLIATSRLSFGVARAIHLAHAAAADQRPNVIIAKLAPGQRFAGHSRVARL